MTRTFTENLFLRKFRQLSPAGRGEVLKYARWLLDAEEHDRMAGIGNDVSNDVSEKRADDSNERRKGKKLLLMIQKQLARLGIASTLPVLCLACLAGLRP